jgi:copper resistance protein D
MINPLILARGIHIAATALAAGTVGFLVLVAEPGAGALRRRLIAMTWTALALAVLSGAAWLLLLAADLTGEPIFEIGGAWQVATETRFGLITGARLTLAAALAVLIVWPRLRWLALAAAAGFIALLGLIGHAGATPGLAGRWLLTSDLVHLLAAGAWLGGLPALALLLAQARGSPGCTVFARTATRRFGWLGAACVAALLASGLFSSWNLLAGPGDLLATDYGRLLSLKLGLVAAMLAIAAVNRFHLTPRLAAPGALRALQRNSLAEAGLGLVVLLLVGALGTLEPTAHIHVHTPSAEIPAEAAFVHIHAGETMADVTIDAGRAGPVRATIRVSRENGTEFPAKELRLALDPPNATARSIEQPAVRQPDGSWKVQRLEIGQPGIWTVRVILVPASGPVLVLDAPIVIER